MDGRVTLTGVSRRYTPASDQTIVAVDQVDLVVESGSMVAVMGPSGSGKSTLLHLVGGMDQADAGRIQVGDVEVSSLKGDARARYRRRIGFMFQRFHLLPALTVLDNVLTPVMPFHTSFNKERRARELLKAVDLEDRADSLPSGLSGGQQQRVAIARALINDPVLVLADEPTGNLDSSAGGEVMRILLELRERRGMTIVLATHDPLVAARCDRLIRLADGRVIEDLAIQPASDEESLLQWIDRPGLET